MKNKSDETNLNKRICISESEENMKKQINKSDKYRQTNESERSEKSEKKEETNDYEQTNTRNKSEPTNLNR